MVKVRRGYRSSNVEYHGSAGRRGGLGGLPFPTGRRGRMGAGVGGAGLVGVIVTVLIAVLGGSSGLSGVDLGGALDAGTTPAGSGPVAAENAYLETVFDDVQNTWTLIFEASGAQYPPATLNIFRESIDTGGCGFATSAVGPFYCPADSEVYLDQAFFDDLATRFGAPGEFAQAYVIAHEIGHHVQNVTGVSSKVRERQRNDPSQQNDLSIRLELQADCLAGVWAHQAANRDATFEGNDNLLYLERGDLRDGLAAAAAVGDDRIQEAATGRSDPHSWTHGSAEQRVAWFTLGIDTGDPGVCGDAFDERVDATSIMPE